MRCGAESQHCLMRCGAESQHCLMRCGAESQHCLMRCGAESQRFLCDSQAGSTGVRNKQTVYHELRLRLNIVHVAVWH